MPSKVWDEITYPFPNFNVCTFEVWEWIGNFIPHFTMDVNTDLCWDLGSTMLVKGTPDITNSLADRVLYDFMSTIIQNVQQVIFKVSP